MRSRETHARHIGLLGGVLNDHVATTYGVQRETTLYQSKFFHVTDGLIPDIMHDVLEGCAPYAVKELLKYLDQNKIATFEQVNDQIEHFAYVPLDARQL